MILFAANIVSTTQVQALTGSLQRAAAQGGNPPLLIATDQEGGQVKRFPNGPPYLSPPQMAAQGTVKGAYREGQLTGSYLRTRGMNWDLAPVSDVPTSSNAFIWQQGRAFSFDASTVASYADAFARGVQSARVVATAKHFPGVGSAPVDTDSQLDVLRPTAAQRAAALLPYEKMIPRGLDSVMVSTAASRHTTRRAPCRRCRAGSSAGCCAGGSGSPASRSPTRSARRPGTTRSPRAGWPRAPAPTCCCTPTLRTAELAALESDLRSGRLGRAAADASYRRIVALKRRIT